MFRINELTRGRFGNKILHYNTLAQLGRNCNREISCAKWEGHDFFSNLKSDHLADSSEIELDWKQILNEDFSLNDDACYIVHQYCLHNVFWKITKTDPREFLKIREKFKPTMSENKTNIGIHFRGTDILGADGNHGREIHKPEYYRSAIDLTEREFNDTRYHLCTDDSQFESYIQTVKYLKERNIDFKCGNINDYWSDFALLSECEILIASSSTFVLCAGFLGRKDKKIIHSQEWLDKNLNHTLWHPQGDPEWVREFQLSFDRFWVELAAGGNEFYKIWRSV